MSYPLNDEGVRMTGFEPVLPAPHTGVLPITLRSALDLERRTKSSHMESQRITFRATSPVIQDVLYQRPDLGVRFSGLSDLTFAKQKATKNNHERMWLCLVASYVFW